MKKVIRTILLITGFVPSVVTAQNNFTIKGQMSVSTDIKKAYLVYSNSSDQEIRDSSLIKNGAFLFEGKIDEPILATIVMDHNGSGLEKMKKQRHVDYKRFYLDKENLVFNATDSIKTSKILGSKINNDNDNYIKQVYASSNLITARLDSEYLVASDTQKKDTAFINSLKLRYRDVFAKTDSNKQKYISANPKSYISLFALREILGATKDATTIKPLFDGLSPELKNSKQGELVKQAIDALSKISVGVIAPDFTQKNADGKPIKLSDFRGKYVLLDFWASWCMPCRDENPNVVKAYNLYKDRNFTVIGVSLDNVSQKDAWASAIAKDGLVWTQVSDLQGWKNEAAILYNVSSIPASFLIDPDGKIIARDLRGDDLMIELKKVIK